DAPWNHGITGGCRDLAGYRHQGRLVDRESRWLGHRSAHGGGGRGAGRADLLTAQQAHAKGQEKNQDQEKACSLPPHLCLRKKGTTRRPGFDASYMEVLRRAIRGIPEWRFLESNRWLYKDIYSRQEKPLSA